MTVPESASLQELGSFLTGKPGGAGYAGINDDVRCELARRVDNELGKAQAVFDYHAAQFRANPCAKHWQELTAMMACVEFIQPGGRGEMPG